ncbi:hypothetical protein GDO81_012008 [Engystomops pustulosus]|uniref:Uncharacterized protein n=1 Tax=Engystomops pustulosus TaxID=76066 RepID=A0AAV7BIH5_ENGPU|nr:hypothetical protein GDO81_012008 [Engystomops pustulosus]
MVRHGRQCQATPFSRCFTSNHHCRSLFTEDGMMTFLSNPEVLRFQERRIQLCRVRQWLWLQATEGRQAVRRPRTFIAPLIVTEVFLLKERI